MNDYIVHGNYYFKNKLLLAWLELYSNQYTSVHLFETIYLFNNWEWCSGSCVCTTIVVHVYVFHL
jgi:hypothetical protein